MDYRNWLAQAHRLIRERAADPGFAYASGELRPYWRDGWAVSQAVDAFLSRCHQGASA